MPKQLLLVDDSVTIHRVVKITFAREDYELTHAKSADDGLAKAKDLKPDVVLADAGMSGKTGYDVCAALRADGSNAAILILTGNFNPYDEARGSKAGADGFMVKPFETQALIDKVNDLVARKSGKAVAASSQPTMAMQAPVLPPPAPAAAPTPAQAAPLTPPPPPQPSHPAAPPPPPVRGWTMAMPVISPTTPLVPPAPPKPVEKPVEPVKAQDKSVEITIEADDEPEAPRAAPPLVPPKPVTPIATPLAAAPKPVAPAPPPLAKPVSPATTPQASTMMMEAPKLPTPSPIVPPSPVVPPSPAVTPPVLSPPAAPQASTMMMEAPKLPTAVPSVPAPPPVTKPSPTGQVRMQATLSHDAPKMPRASLIPHVATPQPHAAPAKPATPAPRATIMGMPAINPNAVAPAAPKAAVPSWAPPPTSQGIKLNEVMAKAEAFQKEAAAAAAAAAVPSPKQDISPLVAAVAEKAQAEVMTRSADVQIMTREIVEKIAWEVVPELAEVMLKEHVEKLASGKK